MEQSYCEHHHRKYEMDAVSVIFPSCEKLIQLGSLPFLVATQSKYDQNCNMRKNLFNWLRIATVFAVALLFVPGPVAADTAVPQILIINSFDGSTSPYVRPKIVFKAELQKQLNTPISFREVNLESNWGSREEREDLVVKFMHDFYANPPPDLVVSIGPPGVEFWLRNRDKVAGKAPFIGSSGEARWSYSDLKPGDAGVLTVLDFTELIDNILIVKPEVSHIVMVFGSSDNERGLTTFARAQLESYEDRINFEYTNDYSLDALRGRLAQLDENSAVFYGMLNYDVDGLTLGNDSGLPFVRDASKAPVFGAMDNQLGRGIVGGRLIDLSGLGLNIANMAVELLRNPREDITWDVIELAEPIYDWRELQAFGIDPERLPAGSVIRYKSPTFWDQYGVWMLLFVSVVALQSLLIATLLFERRNRLRAEKARANVAGKLITAHEDERRHIARELHDDLSQRLVRLAIDASKLDADEKPDLKKTNIDTLQKDIKDISKDIHNLSYRLHPSILEYLGIEDALKTEFQHMGKNCEAKLLDRIKPISNPVSPDAALCTYRIAQEALRNAITHADAKLIEVHLEQNGNKLSLTVRDDGKGFHATADNQRESLGLSSMHERATLIGGKLQVKSMPGEGTTISASIPSDGVNS